MLDGLRRMIIRNILILTVIAALVPTAMSNVSASAAAEIALFSGVSDSDGLSISGNGDTAKMELKATNDNGKTNKVSDYQMNADNVLYIKVGDKVTVEDNVDFTKAITTDGNNNQKAIGITSNGVIDFTGYAQGVSTLDVVVDDDRAYEAIIAIGDQTNQIVDKEITRVNSDYTIKVELPPLVCDEGYHRENVKCIPDDPIPDPPCDPESDPNCIDPPCDPESDPNCIDPPPIVPDPGDPVDPCSIDPTVPDCETPVEPVVLPLVGENTEVPNEPINEFPNDEELGEDSDDSEGDEDNGSDDSEGSEDSGGSDGEISQ